MAEITKQTPSAERIHLMSLEDLREEYGRGGLTEENRETNPIVQFERWVKDAQAADLKEPNAMTLATVSRTGKPSARIVLLKEVSDFGFVFYTNYGSRKGQEIAENPSVALTFYWAELERQVRVEGTAQRVPREQSEAYFRIRPRGSQLGAWVSHQSDVISSREVLQDKLQRLEKEYGNREIPAPEFWGGYCVVPQEIEFWQGRRNRLHDRLRYTRVNGAGWRVDRLSP